MLASNEWPDFLAASGSSTPQELRDFSDDTLSETRRVAQRPRTARRTAKRRADTLWTPAKVGDLDLDAIHEANRQAALDYAARGWKVTPIWGMVASVYGELVCACPLGYKCGRDSGKHPWGGFGLFDRATSDPDTIAQWWEQRPESNVGLVGRDPIGVIIDLDRLKEGETGPDGFELWHELEEQYGPADPTFTEDSGSLGQHLFFQVPPDVVIGNSLPVISDLPKASSGKVKIDVKGRKGYVVAAPSLHQSGNLYQVTQDLPVAMAPDWLVGPSLTTGVRNSAPTRKTPSVKTNVPSKRYDARTEKIMDALLGKMTDKDAPLTSTTNRLIHHGVPGANQSVVTQRIIMGASADNLHPDTLFEMLRNPYNGGGEGLRRRIKERGEEYGYEWMVTSYRESLRYRAEQVATVQDIRADIEEYEWTPTDFGKGGRGHRASPQSMKGVLRAALDIAEQFTTTMPMLNKCELEETTGMSRRTVWAAIQGLIELGWLEVHIKPKRSDAVWTYRLPAAASRKNPRLPSSAMHS